MATPLTATARIKVTYTTDGFVHRYVNYCAYNLVLGIPQLVDRDGITTVLWSLASTYLWDLVRAVMSTTAVGATAVATLESRSGALWNPVAIYPLSGAGTTVGAYSKAQQATWVIRDTAFKKMRYLIFETPFAYLFHSVTGRGYSAGYDAITDGFSGTDASANAPYRWVKTRGDRFLLATGDIAGLTFDLNDKLKRARGLE